MSIIFIDDILFNDNDEDRKIRYVNCILFLILNSLSILSGLFYLYFYFIIPYYQNSSNSLSLYLSLFYLITNIFYFILFFDFCIYKPSKLSITVKIITMFNPLIIFCIYYWTACLTHNLYVTYYKYIHNINKRIKFYKYLLFIIGLIFYIYILLNIHYNAHPVLSENFFLISNYNKSFIDIFYICGLLMIIYIIIKLYYVLNKKEDFISINEYQENQEHNEKIKNIFNLVITTNISFIIYFLLAFTPENISMLLKNLFSYSNMKTFFIDFITIFLISFSGIFMFCIRLLDPLMRAFIANLISLNKKFISGYKEKLIKEKTLDESFISNNGNDIYNVYNENFLYNNNFKRSSKKCKTIAMKTISFNFGKNKNEKKNKNFEISSFFTKKASNSGKFEMDNFNESEQKIYERDNKDIGSEPIDTSSNLNELEENYYLENQEYDNNKKDKDKNSTINKNETESNSIIFSEKERNNSQNSSNKNSLFVNSFRGIDKKNNNNNDKKHISKFRNYTIIREKPLNEENERKVPKFTLRNRIKRSFRKRREMKNLINTRANSTTMGLLKKRSAVILSLQKKRSNSKLNEQILQEEMSNFDLMNYHLEMNDNIVRLIAISIALNECRMYDDIKEYKKFYNSTIPWNNRDFYKERTLFKEYNGKNMPKWI